jgi:hypothetical protein
MKAMDINSKLIEGYLRLLENLSPGSKRDLISKLTVSVNSDTAEKKKLFRKSFGAWQSKKTAEQIISEIRSSRNFNRQTEQL